MADTDEEAIGDDDIVGGLEKKKISGKTIVLIAGGVVVLIIIGVIVMMLLGGDDEPEPVDPVEEQIEELAQGEAAEQAAEKSEADKTPEELQLLFIPLDERVYNLKTDGNGSSFLRMRISLEVDRESYRAEIESKIPRILDELNVYLRELRPSDLNGGAGILLLKEELMMRINQAVAPARVKDVLFQDFVVQGI